MMRAEEAEKALLGAMLRDEKAVGCARTRVSKDDFSDLGNGIAFETIVDVFDETGTTDPVMVQQALCGRPGEWLRDDVDTRGFIVDAVDSCFSAGNVEVYAYMVAEAAHGRRLGQALEAAQNALAGGKDIEQAQDRLRKLMDRVKEGATSTTTRDMGSLIEEVDARVEARATGKDADYVKTGLFPLDRIFHGFVPGRLTILGATSGTGKTALATQIAGNVAVVQGKRVLIISAEMSATDLCENALRQLARVETDRVGQGRFTQSDLLAWQKAKRELVEAPLVVDDTASPNVEAVVGQTVAGMKGTPYALVIVDYVQLLSSREPFATETLRVGHIAKELKGLARRANVPVLALSQITISDDGQVKTRWASEVEYHADALLVMLRDSRYEGNKALEPDKVARRIFRVSKNRFGPARGAMLAFEKTVMSFREWMEGDDEEL